MTGGGSLVWGFDKLVESHTGIETHIADDAISCVAFGTGKSLDSLDQMQDGTMNLSRRRQMNYRSDDLICVSRAFVKRQVGQRGALANFLLPSRRRKEAHPWHCMNQARTT